MSLRNIRVNEDEILRKNSKPVKEMTSRTRNLIQDMLDTMYDANGVGLAAVQVGVLKQVIVIDVGEGPIVLINPEVMETSGEQRGYEGCLSIPDKTGIVTRPNHVKVKALNEDMEEFIVEGEELLARALLHEIDHLTGKLYTDIAEEGSVREVAYEDDEEDEEEE